MGPSARSRLRTLLHRPDLHGGAASRAAKSDPHSRVARAVLKDEDWGAEGERRRHTFPFLPDAPGSIQRWRSRLQPWDSWLPTPACSRERWRGSPQGLTVASSPA